MLTLLALIAATATVEPRSQPQARAVATARIVRGERIGLSLRASAPAGSEQTQRIDREGRSLRLVEFQ